MSGSVMWKACQRRLYSWLSSKCGLPLCVMGVLLAIISAFQFGEVFLEWSREKYAVQFSIYADNIAGKSYETELCPPLPIDIVYTWVNGSDPDLLRQIRQLKKSLAKSTNSSQNSTTPPPSPSDYTCPFNNCVPWRALVIDGSNLTTPLTVETIGATFPSLQKGGVLSCLKLNTSKIHTSPVYVVRFSNEEQVMSILRAGLLDKHGSQVGVTRGFLTSDSQLAGAVKMKLFYLALSNGIHLLNSSKLFRKWMELHYGRDIREVEVKANRTAVVAFKSEDSVSDPPTIPYLFSGEAVSLHQGFLVWLPFSLPNTKEQIELERPDVVSASRFQDNEELRYSLRSIERFAPWVRHVFIVTNGQIPSWLNLDYPRVTLVPHEEIFPNHTHLPTYSSPAIESHLHRIPGLADHFIYLNDDVMFGDHVWPEDFYTHQRGQKVYLSWPVPNCAEGCPPSWIRDKYCDANCNNSACDWDGGDCANASRPGPQGHSYSHSGSSDHCGPGCLDSWLGDRYCDSACRTPECGYDAGDCGTEKWEELLGYNLSPSGGNFSLPLETAALYFNLSDLLYNFSISEASHTPSKLIRTSIVAQKYKTLALTLARNVSMSAVNFTITGKSGNSTLTVNFTVCGDTATKNRSRLAKKEAHQLLTVSLNDTSSQQFLQAVVAKLPSNKSINYWVQSRAVSEHTAPPPTAISRYLVTNLSLLPHDLSEALQQLDAELEAGDWTRKGYLNERAALLHQLPSHLVSHNGSVQFGEEQLQVQRGVAGGGDMGGDKVKGHVELNREDVGVAGISRKLLQVDMERKKQFHLPELAILGWEESRRRLPWEKLHLFPDTITNNHEDNYKVKGHKSRRLMEDDMTDTFADSLRHVNRLYTKVYGHATRKVPSHMPHYIQKQVMSALQDRFPQEFRVTSSHPVRMADDMQFAFSYFYFLMSEKLVFDVEDMFSELDTDRTGILSVRELRTLLALISGLPITMEDVHKLEDMLKTCNQKYNGSAPQVSPREYETLYDSKLPLVTLDFTRECLPLIEKLNETVTTRERYKFEETSSDVINFKMINENASEVIAMLDEIRKEKKKFICLNDNIDHSKPGADLAKLILVDFYESLFPLPSQFEIPGQFRNRFLHLDELKEWLVFKERMHQFLYGIFLITLLLSIASLFYGKLTQWKRKVTRTLSSIFVSKRTPSI